METIISLLQTKNNLKNRQIDPIEAFKVKLLEKLLTESPDMTDAEACQKIYGLTLASKAYKSLKYRLEEKLMNEVFIAASDEFNLKSRVTAKLVVTKYYTISLALLKNHQRKAAIIIAEKALRLSIKYSYTDLTLILLKLMINHYSFVEPDIKKMNAFILMKEQFDSIQAAEDYVHISNAIISHMYIMKKGAFTKEELKEIEERVVRMNELMKAYKSNEIITYTYDLTFFYYSCIGNHIKCLEIAKEALETNLGINNNDLLGIYHCKMNLAVSYFHLRQYDEANKWFEDILSQITAGSRNWIFTCSLYFLNLIGTRDYAKLLKITNEVIVNKNLAKFHVYEEQWRIREAYLHFLIRMGKINVKEDVKNKMKPFVLTKFLNSVPFYSKDKSGQNITIIITQILFLILEKKYGQVIDRIDALNQYTYRYIKNDESFRSNCFIKMLLLAIKADFHPVRTRTYTEDLRKKLINSQLVTDEKSTQVEIIPYDYLWELILELLEKK